MLHISGLNTTIDFLIANADLKMPVFTLFDETYLQRPHCIMIENIENVRLLRK